jgi:hypothetical protein
MYRRPIHPMKLARISVRPSVDHEKGCKSSKGLSRLACRAQSMLGVHDVCTRVPCFAFSMSGNILARVATESLFLYL